MIEYERFYRCEMPVVVKKMLWLSLRKNDSSLCHLRKSVRVKTLAVDPRVIMRNQATTLLITTADQTDSQCHSYEEILNECRDELLGLQCRSHNAGPAASTWDGDNLPFKSPSHKLQPLKQRHC